MIVENVSLSKEAGTLLLGSLQRQNESIALEIVVAHKSLIAQLREYDGHTWLHVAAMYGCAEVCRALIEMSADINDPGLTETAPAGNASTPLVEAVQCGSSIIVELLLKSGAWVDGDPRSVVTPLMVAAIEGHTDVARQLIAAGAEINREHGRWTRTALDLAEIHGHPEIAALLREHGGIRLESDQRDWSGVPGQALIEHMERVVGPVSPLALTQIISGDIELSLRFAQIAPKKQHKLLFTVGLAAVAEMELALCLPATWPLNQAAMKDERFAWPILALWQLGTTIAQGRSLAAGDIISRDDKAFTQLQWPAKVDRLLITPVEVTAVDNLLLLVPLRAKDRIDTEEKKLALICKKAGAKWAALSIE